MGRPRAPDCGGPVRLNSVETQMQIHHAEESLSRPQWPNSPWVCTLVMRPHSSLHSRQPPAIVSSPLVLSFR